MLEHQKVVLLGVSDNKQLFRKEIYKSLRWLNADEIGQLRRWIIERFNGIYDKLIREVFYPKPTLKAINSPK